MNYLNINISTKQALEYILLSLRELINYDLAVVLDIDENKQLKVLKAVGPLANKNLFNYVIDLNQREDIANILKSREPKNFTHDHEQDHVDTYEGIINLPSDHSCLLSPLYYKDDLIGALTFDHSACNQFSDNIVRFIASISKLISIIIVQFNENERLNAEKFSLIQERNKLLMLRKDNIIGTSNAWKVVKEKISLVSKSHAPVLILGETGTGKEQVAKAIHQSSARANGPFIALNCSALVPTLAESELFGHEKGSFSGASAMRKGRFELADGGSLFLDEIGDLPINLQPKLLRVLQEGIVDRVGSEKGIKVDVRIIAATNVDISKAVEEGKFREDLFYRLDVFPIQLPNLREREQDSILLAKYFLEEFCSASNIDYVGFTESAMNKILTLDWPGNVRELKNCIERALILSQGKTIDEQHIISRDGVSNSPKVLSTKPDKLLSFDLEQSKIIIRALKQSNGKIYGDDGAAKILDLKPSTLQSKIKKLNIKL